MATTLSIFGLGFAALCIWLTVRIINRRERWAKRSLACVVGLPVLYVLSFGPACWLADSGIITVGPTFQFVYRPLAWSCVEFENEAIIAAYSCYGELLAQPIPVDDFFNDESAARKLVFIELNKRLLEMKFDGIETPATE